VRSGSLKAIGTMVLGVAVFSLMDAGLKRLSASYPPMQVTCLRGAASLPFLLVSIAVTNSWSQLRTRSLVPHLARTGLGILMLMSFIYSVSVQSLTDSYAVFMSAPLMVAALSWPILGERVALPRWIAIVIGMTGVLIALKPSGAGFISLGGLAAALSAACYSVNALTIRILGRKDTNQAMVFWYILFLTVSAGALAIPGWRPIAAHDWLLIAIVGVTGAIAQQLVTAAFRLATPATVAPFEYTALFWGLGLDFTIFGILPSARVLLGGAIVIVGGLLLIREERRSQSTPAIAPLDF